MSPMLEKIARAARDYMESVNPDEHTADELSLGVARAALLAMREPDDQTMFEAGRLANGTSFKGLGRLSITHTAMIDAILAGETET